MKFVIDRVSGGTDFPIQTEVIGYDKWDVPIYACEINSLEELGAMAQKIQPGPAGWNKTIILNTCTASEEWGGEITIYDDSIE